MNMILKYKLDKIDISIVNEGRIKSIISVVLVRCGMGLTAVKVGKLDGWTNRLNHRFFPPLIECS